MSAAEHFDVLVIGAGLSGIGAAWHIQRLRPARSFAILEARDAIGGTWDLFRYPGVRSDSDMYTLGYPFRPWPGARAIADGAAIRAYIEDTAKEAGLDAHIRFGQRLVRAEWSSRDARWLVTTEAGARFTCGFLYTCTGYYDYAAGYTPDFPGRERFTGRVVHPQAWPPDLDHRGLRVVVIGSGATAVTLVPALAETAAHVTMLQRSPTYVMAMPSHDRLAEAARRVLPAPLAYTLTRWRKVLFAMGMYQLARRRPALVRRLVRDVARRESGPDVDVDVHFNPRYEPWDERVCLAPDADLFHALRDGRASIVTDTIAAFTPTGIALDSGEHLDADLVVTATGLDAKLLPGGTISVDGRPVDLAATTVFKGMMYSGVPNLASAVGYTNASWTLKCDLTAEHVCRLLEHMRAHGYTRATPRPRDPAMATEPIIDLASGYVRRALARFPKQGPRPPWRLYQSYVRDLLMLRYGPVTDPELELARR